LRRDAITDPGLAHFQSAYPAKGEGNSITKEDLFYYIYGLLHSPDYRSRYADNLGKELPRIPAVKTIADFRAFSQAGRDLAHWHLNYETVALPFRHSAGGTRQRLRHPRRPPLPRHQDEVRQNQGPADRQERE
jgi:predicted helicase